MGSPFALTIRPSASTTTTARSSAIIPHAHAVVTTPSGKKLELQVTLSSCDHHATPKQTGMAYYSDMAVTRCCPDGLCRLQKHA